MGRTETNLVREKIQMKKMYNEKWIHTQLEDARITAALRRLIQPRCVVFMRVNLDGTFTIGTTVNNNANRTKNSSVSVRGHSLLLVAETAADQFEKKQNALEIIP